MIFILWFNKNSYKLKMWLKHPTFHLHNPGTVIIDRSVRPEDLDFDLQGLSKNESWASWTIFVGLRFNYSRFILFLTIYPEISTKNDSLLHVHTIINSFENN